MMTISSDDKPSSYYNQCSSYLRDILTKLTADSLAHTYELVRATACLFVQLDQFPPGQVSQPLHIMLQSIEQEQANARSRFSRILSNLAASFSQFSNYSPNLISNTQDPHKLKTAYDELAFITRSTPPVFQQYSTPPQTIFPSSYISNHNQTVSSKPTIDHQLSHTAGKLVESRRHVPSQQAIIRTPERAFQSSQQLSTSYSPGPPHRPTVPARTTTEGGTTASYRYIMPIASGSGDMHNRYANLSFVRNHHSSHQSLLRNNAPQIETHHGETKTPMLNTPPFSPIKKYLQGTPKNKDQPISKNANFREIPIVKREVPEENDNKEKGGRPRNKSYLGGSSRSISRSNSISPITPVQVESEVKKNLKNIIPLVNLVGVKKGIFKPTGVDSRVPSQFEKATAERLDFSFKPSKIESIKEGRTILYSGDAIGTIQRENFYYVDKGVSFSDIKVCQMKSLRNGYIILNDLKDWDLVILDSSLREKGRLKGEGGELPFYYKSMNLRSVSHDKFIIWLNEPSSASIVKVPEFTSTHIKNFWVYKGKLAQPYAMVVGSDGTLLVGLGEVEEVMQTLHFYRSPEEFVAVFELGKLFGKGNLGVTPASFFACLEVSLSEDVLFVGGGDNSDLEAVAYLIAFDMKAGMKLAQYAKFPKETGFGLVSVIKRHPNSDTLFLGTQKYIVVVEWDGSEFKIISQFENFSSQPPTDFSLEGNVLFSVADDDVGTVIHFDDSVLRNRDIRLNITRLEKQKMSLGGHDDSNKMGDSSFPSGAKGKDLLSAIIEAGNENKSQIFTNLGQDQKLDERTTADIFANLINKADGANKKAQNRIPTAHLVEIYDQIQIRKIAIEDFGEGSQEIQRVDFLMDGSQIVYGKNTLHRLISRASHFIKLKTIQNIRPFIDMKMLNTGEVLIFEEETFDLVKYDGQSKQLSRLSGKKSPCVGTLS